MSTFHLRVLTADKQFFEGDVEKIVLRTTEGDVGILPKHIRYVAALGIGAIIIFENGSPRIAAVSGGFVEVLPDRTTVLARTAEWANEIDVARAREAEATAKTALAQATDLVEKACLQRKVKKAENRIRIAEK